MKAGLFCIAAGAAVATAIPLAGHNHHAHRHVEKRNVVTETTYVTATAAPVIVYVDQNGNTISPPAAAAPSTHEAQAPSSYVAPSSSAAAAPAPSAYSSKAPAAPAPSAYSSEAPAPAPSSYSAAEPSSKTSSAAPAYTSPSDSGADSGYGMVYSPYNSDSTCKTQDQVNQDFENISGYQLIRIYGTDCNQVSTVMNAASAKGMKLFAGVYDITQVDSEIQTIIDAASSNWDAIHTVSIGNEGVQMGTYTVSAVVSAMNSARSQLKSAGYSGNVVTVDTSGMLIAYPELCQNSDFAAANCHSFFNSDIDAAGSGDYVLSQAQAVSKACGGKNTWITESGYPWKGDSNGMQVPSPANQAAAISSLKQSFASNIILFTSYNDYWKQDNAGTFGAEKYWGIMGNAPSA